MMENEAETERWPIHFNAWYSQSCKSACCWDVFYTSCLVTGSDTLCEIKKLSMLRNSFPHRQCTCHPSTSFTIKTLHDAAATIGLSFWWELLPVWEVKPFCKLRVRTRHTPRDTNHVTAQGKEGGTRTSATYLQWLKDISNRNGALLLTDWTFLHKPKWSCSNRFRKKMQNRNEFSVYIWACLLKSWSL